MREYLRATQTPYGLVNINDVKTKCNLKKFRENVYLCHELYGYTIYDMNENENRI